MFERAYLERVKGIADKVKAAVRSCPNRYLLPHSPGPRELDGESPLGGRKGVAGDVADRYKRLRNEMNRRCADNAERGRAAVTETPGTRWPRWSSEAARMP